MTTQLTLHTKAAAGALQFETFWTTGRKQGIVHVTIADPNTEDAAIVAELSAMHYLLSHKEVCGNERAGNGMELNVTFGAIRKLAQNTGSKKHLFAHGRFLLARYAEARITVAKDTSWIVQARAENRRDSLHITAPLPEIVDVQGIGKVGLSYHIIDRMMERANYASIAAAWRHLCKMLGCSNLAEVPLPADIARQKADKHGSVGKHLRVPSEPWRFVISDGKKGFTADPLPMLVTAYVRC